MAVWGRSITNSVDGLEKVMKLKLRLHRGILNPLKTNWVKPNVRERFRVRVRLGKMTKMSEVYYVVARTFTPPIGFVLVSQTPRMQMDIFA